MQELITAREQPNQLEYMLEQEKTINTELVRETDYCEEALQKAQEKIDHRDDAVVKAKARIKDLEQWVNKPR